MPGVIRDQVLKTDKYHLTREPTELRLQLVRICELEGRVLDPLGGSGTMLITAKEEGSGWIGFELTQHDFDVARTPWFWSSPARAQSFSCSRTRQHSMLKPAEWLGLALKS
jgi:hypothetical protein